MQNNQFTISINALKGLDLLAGKQDIRYYLNGVNVAFNESCTRLTATNGHILGVENLTQNLVNTGSGSVIIPSDIIKALKPAGRGCDIVQVKQIPAIYEGDAPRWELDNYGTKITFSGLEGTFPDCARVCSQIKTSGEAAQYDFDYLAMFKKAAKLLTGAKTPVLYVYQNGRSAAIIKIEGLPSFAGVVMPVRGDHGTQQAGALIDPALYNPLPVAGAASGETYSADGVNTQNTFNTEPVAAAA